MAEITSAPTELSKVIPVSFKINDVNSMTTGKLQTGKQFNTSDTDAWLEFTLEGLSASGTYDLTLINLDEAPDNSIFKHTDLAFSGVPFHYKLDSGSNMETNEIRHAGRWLGQIVVRMDNGDTTSRQFVFSIAGHILDGKVAQVVLLEDYNALIATITASKDLLTQYNIDYAALLADINAAEAAREQAEIDRAATFNALVDSEMIAQNVETKLTEKEATFAPRMLSLEEQLAQNLAMQTGLLKFKGSDTTANINLKTGMIQGDYWWSTDGFTYYAYTGTVWSDVGSSLTELADSRINHDGGTFATAGENIRSIGSILKTGKVVLKITDWVGGGIGGVDGQDTVSTVDLRTSSYHRDIGIGETLTINIATGYKLMWFAYDTSQNFIKTIGWVTGTHQLVTDNPVYRFRLAKSDGTTMTTDLASNVSFEILKNIYEVGQVKTALQTEITDKVNLANAVKNLTLFNTILGHVYVVKLNKRIIDGVHQIDIYDVTSSKYVASFYAATYTEPVGYIALDLLVIADGITGTLDVNWSMLPTGTINKDVYLPINTIQPFTQRWYGKKWYAVGDSFTEQDKYPYYLNQYCKFASYYNAGQSGLGMASMASKFAVESLVGYDLVTVLAGTNDYGGNTPLGTMADDSTVASFYGYTKKVIEAIIAQSPTIRVAFFTPVIRGAFLNQPVYPAPNTLGFTLDDYVDAIVEVCQHYAIPCLDTFRCSQFNLLNLTTMTDDNLHPSYFGAKVLAKKIQGFIEAL